MKSCTSNWIPEPLETYRTPNHHSLPQFVGCFGFGQTIANHCVKVELKVKFIFNNSEYEFLSISQNLILIFSEMGELQKQ